MPDLLWDSDDDVWRMWFVSEDEGSIRYTESDDDGINWGITSTSTSIDCYDTDDEEFDTTKCVALAWASGSAPPEDTDTTDAVVSTIDPGVILLDLDSNPGLETLGMFLAGADDRCDGDTTNSVGEKRVIIVGTHDALGDQSGSDSWSWDNTVHADSLTGVLIEQHSTDCESDDTDTDSENFHEQVYDPAPLMVSADKYIMFFGMRPDGDPTGNLYVAASGFQCSDFVDNGDTDTLADYGNGMGMERTTATTTTRMSTRGPRRSPTTASTRTATARTSSTRTGTARSAGSRVARTAMTAIRTSTPGRRSCPTAGSTRTATAWWTGMP